MHSMIVLQSGFLSENFFTLCLEVIASWSFMFYGRKKGLKMFLILIESFLTLNFVTFV